MRKLNLPLCRFYRVSVETYKRAWVLLLSLTQVTVLKAGNYLAVIYSMRVGSELGAVREA